MIEREGWYREALGEEDLTRQFEDLKRKGFPPQESERLWQAYKRLDRLPPEELWDAHYQYLLEEVNRNNGSDEALNKEFWVHWNEQDEHALPDVPLNTVLKSGWYDSLAPDPDGTYLEAASNIPYIYVIRIKQNILEPENGGAPEDVEWDTVGMGLTNFVKTLRDMSAQPASGYVYYWDWNIQNVGDEDEDGVPLSGDWAPLTAHFHVPYTVPNRQEQGQLVWHVEHVETSEPTPQDLALLDRWVTE